LHTDKPWRIANNFRPLLSKIQGGHSALLWLLQNPDPRRPAKSIAGLEQTCPTIGPKEAVQWISFLCWYAMHVL
jgi:hypothetical protein